MRGRMTLTILLGLLAGAPADAAVLDRVKETGVIRIGYRVDARPHSYIDASGQPAGYIVDLCREVAASVRQAIAPTTLRIDYIRVTAANRFEAVKNGEVDLLCEASSITMSRRALVDFSLPTFVDGAAILSRHTEPIRGFEDFSGRRVGVLRGTTTEQVLDESLSALNIRATIRRVNDHHEGARLVAANELDAYFADRSILAMLLYRREMPQGLVLAPRYFSYETYGIALPRGDDAFRLLVDRTLARLYRSGVVGSLIKRAFGSDPDELLRMLIAINAMPD